MHRTWDLRGYTADGLALHIEAGRHHIASITERLHQMQAASQAQVISELNPLLRGWAAYYCEFVSVHSLSKYDRLVEHLLLNWARKRHPGKEPQEIISRYWHAVDGETWIFSTPEGVELCSHGQRRGKERSNPYENVR